MTLDLSTDASSQLYSQKLVERAAQAQRPQRLARPQLTATAVSPICGSVVTVDLIIDGDVVKDFGFEVEACALTKAALAVMQEVIRGQTRAKIRAAGEVLEKMLRESGAAPAGHWQGLALLEPVRDFKARHNSILLPFAAVEKAFVESKA